MIMVINMNMFMIKWLPLWLSVSLWL